MTTHGISSYSEVNAGSAIAAAVAEATADYGDAAKSVHIVVSSVFKVGDGWKAVVIVVIEPDLEEKLDKELKHEDHHEKKLEKKKTEEGLDMHFDVSSTSSVDNNPETGGLLHSSETLDAPDISPSLFLTGDKLNTSGSSLASEAPSNQYAGIGGYAKYDPDIGGMYSFYHKDTPLNTTEESEVTVALDKLRSDSNDAAEVKTEPLTYVYIPSSYSEAYDELASLEIHAHIHLVEEGPLWANIQDYFLDVKFYEATHIFELEKRHEADSRQFQENMKAPRLQKKMRGALQDLELDG